MAATRNVPVSEYTPLQVKQSVTGYGKAEKKQVMEMTRQLLGLAQIPKPDDARYFRICPPNSSHSLWHQATARLLQKPKA